MKLAQSAQQAMQIISDSLTALRKDSDKSPIVLSCERSIALKWLIPRLSQFQDMYPEIPVHLSVGGGPLNFVKDGVTLALRRIDFPLEPECVLSELLDEEMGPVMQPSMETDFRKGRYIGLGSKTRPNAWREYLANNSDAPKPQETRLFDHHFLMAEAAASGLGVAMCPKIVAIDELSTGRLSAPAGFAKDGSSYSLISLKFPALSAEADTLANWIIDASSTIA